MPALRVLSVAALAHFPTGVAGGVRILDLSASASVPRLPALEELSICGVLHAAELPAVARLGRLRSLAIAALGEECAAAAVACLSALTALTSLRCDDAGSTFGEAQLAALCAPLVGLRRLSFRSGARLLTGWSWLAPLAELERLSLTHAQLPTAALPPGVTSLRYSGPLRVQPLPAAAAAADGVPAAPRLAALRELRVSEAPGHAGAYVSAPLPLPPPGAAALAALEAATSGGAPSRLPLPPMTPAAAPPPRADWLAAAMPLCEGLTRLELRTYSPRALFSPALSLLRRLRELDVSYAARLPTNGVPADLFAALEALPLAALALEWEAPALAALPPADNGARALAKLPHLRRLSLGPRLTVAFCDARILQAAIPETDFVVGPAPAPPFVAKAADAAPAGADEAADGAR
jgi:hypothetical protein